MVKQPNNGNGSQGSTPPSNVNGLPRAPTYYADPTSTVTPGGYNQSGSGTQTPSATAGGSAWPGLGNLSFSNPLVVVGVVIVIVVVVAMLAS